MLATVITCARKEESRAGIGESILKRDLPNFYIDFV